MAYGHLQKKCQLIVFMPWRQIGSKATVKAGLETLLAKYDVDEFIFTCDIYDTEKRLYNFDLLMQIKKNI